MNQKNNTFLDDVITEVYEEGAGTFAYAQQTGAISWNNRPSPPCRSSTSDEHGYGVKDISEEEEEFTHKAPKIKPFPLENLATFLVDAYINLCEANGKIKLCINSNTVVNGEANSPASKALQKQYDNIEKIKESIKKVSGKLDIIEF